MQPIQEPMDEAQWLCDRALLTETEARRMLRLAGAAVPLPAHDQGYGQSRRRWRADTIKRLVAAVGITTR